jgi:hypothetical protein
VRVEPDAEPLVDPWDDTPAPPPTTESHVDKKAPAMAPPGYHIYRPSSAPPAPDSDDQ